MLTEKISSLQGKEYTLPVTAMWKSQALKDDVLTALYLQDSITDSSTSSEDSFMLCHTEHDRGSVLYPNIVNYSVVQSSWGAEAGVQAFAQLDESLSLAS